MYSNQSKGRHASKAEGELQSNRQSVSRLMPKNVKTIEAVFSLLSCPSWHVQHRYHEQQTGLLSPLHVSFLPATLCPYAQALPPISLHSFFQLTRLPPLSNPFRAHAQNFSSPICPHCRTFSTPSASMFTLLRPNEDSNIKTCAFGAGCCRAPLRLSTFLRCSLLSPIPLLLFRVVFHRTTRFSRCRSPKLPPPPRPMPSSTATSSTFSPRRLELTQLSSLPLGQRSLRSRQFSPISGFPQGSRTRGVGWGEGTDKKEDTVW